MLRLPYSRSVLLRLWSFLRSAALPVGCPTVAFAIAVRLDTAPVALFVMLALGIVVTSRVVGRERAAGAAFLGTALLDGYRAMRLPAGRSPGGATALASMAGLLACALLGAFRETRRARSSGSVSADRPVTPRAPRTGHMAACEGGDGTRTAEPGLPDGPRELVGAGRR